MHKLIYCTYLTVYTGNKLPPFYIGSTSVDNISKGYRGSVLSKNYKSIWKQELHSHPDLFKMSAAHTGKILSPEHKAKIAAARTGKKRGPYKKKLDS